MWKCSWILIFTGILPAQTLPVKWEELTAGDFVKGIQQSRGTCVLPFGILEKHGPHLPLGNDLINARYSAVNGAEQEYAVVFPEYYFGQIFEAKHQPGTIAYSPKLQLELLQETTDEMARNGCKKILIVNGTRRKQQPSALLCPIAAGFAEGLCGLRFHARPLSSRPTGDEKQGRRARR